MFARTEAFTMSFVGLEREIKGSLGPFWEGTLATNQVYLIYIYTVHVMYSAANN